MNFIKLRILFVIPTLIFLCLSNQAIASFMYKTDDGRIWLANVFPTDRNYEPIGSYSDVEGEGFASETRRQETIHHTGNLPREEDGTALYCENKWPRDFSMQAYCANKQRQSAGNVKQILNEIGILDANGNATDAVESRLGQALNQCFMKWSVPRFGTKDWTMVEYCSNEQISAYKSLTGT